MRRLSGIRIAGLLNRPNDEIVVTIPADWEFVILHGPNGVGKTKLLEIISHTFSFRHRTLADTPFTSAAFFFDDGSRLTVNRLTNPPLPLAVSESASESPHSPRLEYHLAAPHQQDISWTFPIRLPQIRPGLFREIERYLPVARVGPDLWIDHTTGEYLNAEILLDKYDDEIPNRQRVQPDLPEALTEFVKSVNIHLIETQRLLRFVPSQRGQQGIRQRATVDDFAEDLTRRIAATLAQNSRTSQQLDRTFPQRILKPRSTAIVASDDEIRARYEQQIQRRNSLVDITVLDPYADLPLPQRDLQDWERRVLWQWLDDSDQKLATFEELLDRITLMKELINSRFLDKELIIDSEQGFRFRTRTNQDLSAHQLSSGEQHELVLLYELLFKVSRNSIVLVDEPEISLHILWQQQFLNDITRVASLTDLQFIIATHSPQIVHTWADRMVSLSHSGSNGDADA